jgi:hypothetical protein
MHTPPLARLDRCVLLNPAQIVSVTPAPMLSNAIRFDIHMTNGAVHVWSIAHDEDAETALQRLILNLAQQ